MLLVTYIYESHKTLILCNQWREFWKEL